MGAAETPPAWAADAVARLLEASAAPGCGGGHLETGLLLRRILAGEVEPTERLELLSRLARKVDVAKRVWRCYGEGMTKLPGGEEVGPAVYRALALLLGREALRAEGGGGAVLLNSAFNALECAQRSDPEAEGMAWLEGIADRLIGEER